jgi:hypothetical protein
MKDIDTTLVFRVLKKMGLPLTEMDSFKHGVIDAKGNVIVHKHARTPVQEKAFSPLERLVIGMKQASSPMAYVSAARLMREYVQTSSNQDTAFILLERMNHTKLVNPNIVKHDIGTYEGFMAAVDEMMSEMFSGASMGGAMSGAGTNADINATGMAGIDKPLRKKRKSIDKILSRRL